MLIEFSVENFKSIKDKAILSLVSTKDDSLQSNLINCTQIEPDKLLKTAVIYGANASGKSNIISAINFLKALVLNSHNHQQGQGVAFTPFKLDKETINKPTKMEAIFIQKNIKYVYGVSFIKEKIIDEYLYYYPNGKKAKVFERKNTIQYEFTIEQQVQEFIAKRTLDNMLYLSKSTQEKYEKTANAFEWFREILQILPPIEQIDLSKFTVDLIKNDPSFKELVLKALCEADIGIEDLKTDIRKVSASDLPDFFPPQIKEMIISDKLSTLQQIDIKTSHKGVEFNFNSEESEGTKRIFSIIGPIIDSLRNGMVLIVDELDIRLHHLLNLFLINLFHDPTQNKSNAQLIFTTHNVLLLDQDLFRRDQIWFTEKNNNTGSTDLYSLWEYSPRKDKDIKKGYLAGKYGALPFIKDFKIF